MNKLAEKVQQALVTAIDNDDLVLPTLPEVALKIRQAAEDPEISISHLSKVISRDTALSARLIKVVNSPLLRASQEVTDLHTAIDRDGRATEHRPRCCRTQCVRAERGRTVRHGRSSPSRDVEHGRYDRRADRRRIAPV